MAVPASRKLDRADRREKVANAMLAIAALHAVAVTLDTEEAWAAFEFQAAILHRQSRLLAGKSKGG